jgi:hypothetical protein
LGGNLEYPYNSVQIVAAVKKAIVLPTGTNPATMPAAPQTSAGLDPSTDGMVEVIGLDVLGKHKGISLPAISEQLYQLPIPLSPAPSESELNQLLIRQRFLLIVAQGLYEERFPPLAPSEQDAIRRQLDEFGTQLESVLAHDLVDTLKLFDRKLLAATVSAQIEGLRPRVGRPDSYWLTRLLTANELSKLYSEIQERLQDSNDQITSRNAANERGRATQELILFDILNPVFDRYLELSSDPARRDATLEKLLPEYAKVSDRIMELNSTAVARPENAEHPAPAMRPQLSTQAANQPLPLSQPSANAADTGKREAWLVFDKELVDIPTTCSELDTTASFVVSNTGDRTVNITAVNMSCGCMKYTLDKTQLKPNESEK